MSQTHNNRHTGYGVKRHRHQLDFILTDADGADNFRCINADADT